MLNEEVKRFEEISGERADETSVARIGGFLDGYEKCQENIVHCKDCKHWLSLAKTYDNDDVGQCRLTNWLCGKNGYCLYGEVEK